MQNRCVCYLLSYMCAYMTYQARLAEEAGACAVMALERVPADIRAEGGVARMVCNDPAPRSDSY